MFSSDNLHNSILVFKVNNKQIFVCQIHTNLHALNSMNSATRNE